MIMRGFCRLVFKAFFIWFCSILISNAQVTDTTDSKEITKITELSYPIFVAPAYDSSIENYSVAKVPSPRGKGIVGYISDPKGYLDTSSTLRINKLLFELEQKSSVEVAVILLPSIGDEVPKSFAVDLFEEWGIGKADTDNGLLLLTIMDQRRTEFEVGNGLEGILTDVVCYRIGVNEIVPRFKEGDFGGGIENAILRIKEFLEQPESIDEVYGYSVVHETQPFKWQWWHFLLVLAYPLICTILGFWYFGQAYDIKRSKDDYYDKYHRLDKLKFGCLQFIFPLPMVIFGLMVKKRLKEYRNAPRFSKKNGQPMSLLTNFDEIEFLADGQLIEEELKAVLYDVWKTEDNSDIMFLEYEGPNGRKYSDCKECSYQTYGKISSLILVAATYDHGGSRIDRYECRNCNYFEEKEIATPQKRRPSESSGSSFSSSGSGSSSSSFGGGSSSGGGAGVSW